MEEVLKTQLVSDYGAGFSEVVGSVNEKLVKQNVKNFDVMTIVAILMGVMQLLKNCNFQLPSRLNFFQKRRLTRTISHVMLDKNDAALEDQIYDVLLVEHKNMTQNKLDNVVAELKNSGKLVD
jgi:hypothetical protein